MFIGKWNKSVILTYIGLVASIIGMYLAISLENGVKYAFICFIIAGVCDMFDGYIARKCKRTEEEKRFGIQLDSLVDVVSFVIFPIIIMISIGLTNWYNVLFYCMYAIGGVARLGYFNILADNSSKEPIKYYLGLPVTFSTIIYALGYIAILFLDENVFKILYSFLPFIISLLNISKIRIKKPGKISYIFYSIIAIVTIFVYILFI